MTNETKEVNELKDEQLELISGGSFWRDLAAGVFGGALGGIVATKEGGASGYHMATP